MTRPNTILLIGQCRGRHEEYKAKAALKPGHLIEQVLDSSEAKVQKHSTYGGPAERMFATEDALQGKTVIDAYAIDDVVMCHLALPGDVILGRLPIGAAAVVLCDKLISNGDGALVKAPALGGTQLYVNAAASTAVSNGVTTEQFFDVTYTVGANSLKVGDILEIEGWAVVSVQASTDTLIVKVYLGGTAIVTTAAVDSAVGDIVHFKATVVVRTIGASGTFIAGGTQGNGVPGTVTAKPFFVASTAIDTTATQVIRASATFSATTATNTVALQTLRVNKVKAAPGELLCMAMEAVDNSVGADEAFVQVRVLN